MFLPILLIAMAQTAGADTGGLTAAGTLTPREIPFHHVARYRVEAEGPSGAEISIAPWDPALPGLAVRAGEPESTPAGGGRQTLVQEIQLTPAYPSRYALPEVVVLLNGQPAVRLEPGELTVRPLTPEEEAAAGAFESLVTLAQLEEEKDRPWWPALLVAGALLAGGAVLWFRRGFSWPMRDPVLRPIDHALAQLEVLEAQVERGDAACESIYVALSAVLREYLERGFGLQAAELSTPELVGGPLEELPVPADVKASLAALLVDADRVKFAQDGRDREQQRGALSSARALIAELDGPEAAGVDLPGAA